MANISFKSITFPGLANKYQVPEISNDLMTAGKAADSKATGDALGALEDLVDEETSKLKADLGDVELSAEVSRSLIEDIAEISVEFTKYDKDSESVTSEVGKKITGGNISSGSSYSYIKMVVPENGYFYPVASPTDSGCYVYDGTSETLSSATLVKSASKSSFPNVSNPWRVTAGQIVAVSSKTTSVTQSIYLSNYGTARITGFDGITILENGYDLISHFSEFTGGRWGTDGSHTSTYIIRSSGSITFDKDTLVLCDLGFGLSYYTYNETAGTWSQTDGKCTALLKAGVQYRLNLYKIDETAPSSISEVTDHVRAINVITSEYEKYKHTFFGLEMYNKIAIAGDSYSMKRATYNNCWGQIIGRKLGIDVSLFGHSGYTTNTFRTATGESNSLTGMLTANASELYWLGFGINDSAAAKSDPTYIGSVEDLSGSYADYPNTLWGNYGCIIESIQATFPSAKIVLCNVMYHDMRTMQVIKDTTNIPLVNSALAEIAEHYGIPLINLMDDIFYKSAEYDRNMQATAYTHPDPILFPGMANANQRLFAKAVADNPAYFKTSTAGND